MESKKLLNRVLQNGDAAEKFSKMVSHLGGPNDIIQDYSKSILKAPIIKPIYSDKSGYINRINTRGIGILITKLGGGRVSPTDKIDYSVGLSEIASLGEYIEKDKPICFVHANSLEDVELVKKDIQILIQTSDRKVIQNKLIYEKIE